MRSGRLVALAAVVAISGLTGGAFRPPAYAAQEPVPVGPFVVDGPLIRDAGRGSLPFYVRGVNRPGNFYCYAGLADRSQHGLSGSQIPASDFTAMRAWGVNTVRLMLSQALWLTDGVAGASPACPGYRQAIVDAVANAHAAGLVVILTLAVLDNAADGEPVYNPCSPNLQSIPFWVDVARTFMGDPRVMFDVFGEPHDISWQVWRNGGVVTTCRTAPPSTVSVGMQSLVSAVRAAGASNVVIASGNGYAKDLSGVSPLLTGANVAYGVHVYDDNASMDERTPFFVDLAAEAPVVVTEYGATLRGCTNHNTVPDPVNHPYTYATDLLDFLRARGIGSVAWQWYVLSPSFGYGGCQAIDLLSDLSGSCTSQGCPVRDAMLGEFSGQLTYGAPPVATSYPAGTLRYGFETGVEGWQPFFEPGRVTVGTQVGIADSGTSSLSVHLAAVPYDSYPSVGVNWPAGLAPGRKVRLRVFSTYSANTSLWPEVYDTNGQLRQSRARFYLDPGWNDVWWVVPDLPGVRDLVIGFDDPTGEQMDVYFDSITW